MKQRLSDVLAVEFICPTTIAVGDIAIIDDDKKIIKCNAAASLKKVGTVATHKPGATTCVVETPFRERRDDRLSGAAVAVGPFVWDANMKVIAYSSSTHDGASIAGVVITAADGADEKVETLEY